jgi:hypothetical protein
MNGPEKRTEEVAGSFARCIEKSLWLSCTVAENRKNDVKTGK